MKGFFLALFAGTASIASTSAFATLTCSMGYTAAFDGDFIRSGFQENSSKSTAYSAAASEADGVLSDFISAFNTECTNLSGTLQTTTAGYYFGNSTDACETYDMGSTWSCSEATNQSYLCCIP